MLYVLYNSGIHGASWPINKTHAVYRLTYSTTITGLKEVESGTFTNERSTAKELKLPRHAESQMISHIEIEIKDTHIKTVQALNSTKPAIEPQRTNSSIVTASSITARALKIFINYSPCAACSVELINFKSRHNVYIETIAAAPYYCQQLRCAICYSNAIPVNTEGLRNLKRSGIVLRGFSYSDWVALAGHLGTVIPSLIMYNTLQPGTNCHYPQPNDSRASADANASSDFNQLC